MLFTTTLKKLVVKEKTYEKPIEYNMVPLRFLDWV